MYTMAHSLALTVLQCHRMTSISEVARPAADSLGLFERLTSNSFRQHLVSCARARCTGMCRNDPLID